MENGSSDHCCAVFNCVLCIEHCGDCLLHKTFPRIIGEISWSRHCHSGLGVLPNLQHLQSNRICISVITELVQLFVRFIYHLRGEFGPNGIVWCQTTSVFQAKNCNNIPADIHIHNSLFSVH